jgi:hypothetical protein
MVTRTRTLTLPGHEVITAKLTTADPTTDVPIHWTGPVSVLPRQKQTGSPFWLETFLKNVATERGGRLEIADSGTFDIWDE